MINRGAYYTGIVTYTLSQSSHHSTSQTLSKLSHQIADEGAPDTLILLQARLQTPLAPQLPPQLPHFPH